MKIRFLFLILFLIATVAFSQNVEQVVYKQIGDVSLTLDIYYPENLQTDKTFPAMVFFFGGGWKSGKISQFEPHAKYFSNRDIICFLADYRVSSRHNTTPFDALKDAKSAIRFVRENAAKYHVDPNQIISSGGSAGGHLAAATALVPGFNDLNDDLSTSCVPNALVLFNPVIDNGPGGYGYERISDSYKSFSPLHNIQKGAPPTILFLGTQDQLIPVETAHYYKKVMEKVGGRCDLFLYEGQGHGFFNFSHKEFYDKTVEETDNFLTLLGYLKELEN